jgi:tryptophanyl-tRNA synthetase
MSLRDGTKKMSKSDPSDYSRINLTDDADAISQKIRKAKTDPEPLPTEKEGFAAAGGRNLSRSMPRSRTDGGGRAARSWAVAVLRLQGRSWTCRAALAPIAGEMRRLMDDPVYIDGVLIEGANRAR